MKTKKRLIDVSVCLEDMCDRCNIENEGCPCEPDDCFVYNVLQNATTVDAVSRGVYDQVRWERDIAIQQLEEHGIPFGGIAPDVVKVVRCKDCMHWLTGYCNHFAYYNYEPLTSEDDFCSYGERREGDNK